MRLALFSLFFLFAAPFCELLAESAFSKLPSAEFLAAVRNPPGRESWARMAGTLGHRRQGSDEIESKIRMGVLFTPARTVAQLAVDGGETYEVGQAYAAGPDSTVVSTTGEPKSGKPLLARIGLRPQDLTMSFLFWNAGPELPRDSFKGQACRVFVFTSQDKSEQAKVWISADYCFPLKVEWAKPGESKPVRTLEVDSFRKEKDFWLIGSLLLFGPGWKTKIEFDEAGAGLSKDGVPADLFLQEKPVAGK